MTNSNTSPQYVLVLLGGVLTTVFSGCVFPSSMRPLVKVGCSAKIATQGLCTDQCQDCDYACHLPCHGYNPTCWRPWQCPPCETEWGCSDVTVNGSADYYGGRAPYAGKHRGGQGTPTEPAPRVPTKPAPMNPMTMDPMQPDVPFDPMPPNVPLDNGPLTPMNRPPLDPNEIPDIPENAPNLAPERPPLGPGTRTPQGPPASPDPINPTDPPRPANGNSDPFNFDSAPALPPLNQNSQSHRRGVRPASFNTWVEQARQQRGAHSDAAPTPPARRQAQPPQETPQQPAGFRPSMKGVNLRAPLRTPAPQPMPQTRAPETSPVPQKRLVPRPSLVPMPVPQTHSQLPRSIDRARFSAFLDRHGG